MFLITFELDKKSPYMLLVSPIKKELCIEMSEDEKKLLGLKINIPRSLLPAITHVDYSARVQTVSERNNPRYYKLISAFKKLTSHPAIVNTSFNVRGEPIVCSPQDAYRCFMRTEMDILVLQNQILFKNEQTNFEKDETWKQKIPIRLKMKNNTSNKELREFALIIGIFFPLIIGWILPYLYGKDEPIVCTPKDAYRCFLDEIWEICRID